MHMALDSNVFKDVLSSSVDLLRQVLLQYQKDHNEN